MKTLDLILISFFGISLSFSQPKFPKMLAADLNNDGVTDTAKVNKTETGFYDFSIIDGKTGRNLQKFPRYSGYEGLYCGQDNNENFLVYLTEKNNEGTFNGFEIRFDRENNFYIVSYKEFAMESLRKLSK